ncbi:hypothetical protein CAOG_02689 [Capsaspora owczarzaki ATCC 30864]|uniref:Uncharacterized protein n=1 Tax=Capsaspora owczarzaki (strain ATCC 30864) TaxID=595528 RepID=A0A0D2WMV0_CAPO3|nr:hypothetical protein CAOG_02689 [Capsaspora owczarzaki ATCC 30864]KJE91563.1 hypothetical protein CAOG_002689 [Capsaspora owczarzaki ATCC 30864]|eukprot:XP_004349439.2 hypothetical protein CAOG_02689 [Capsaspora owczarzaki ATCC 30864]
MSTMDCTVFTGCFTDSSWLEFLVQNPDEHNGHYVFCSAQKGNIGKMTPLQLALCYQPKGGIVAVAELTGAPRARALGEARIILHLPERKNGKRGRKSSTSPTASSLPALLTETNVSSFSASADALLSGDTSSDSFASTGGSSTPNRSLQYPMPVRGTPGAALVAMSSFHSVLSSSSSSPQQFSSQPAVQSSSRSLATPSPSVGSVDATTPDKYDCNAFYTNIAALYVLDAPLNLQEMVAIFERCRTDGRPPNQNGSFIGNMFKKSGYSLPRLHHAFGQEIVEVVRERCRSAAAPAPDLPGNLLASNEHCQIFWETEHSRRQWVQGVANVLISPRRSVDTPFSDLSAASNSSSPRAIRRSHSTAFGNDDDADERSAEVSRLRISPPSVANSDSAFGPFPSWPTVQHPLPLVPTLQFQPQPQQHQQQHQHQQHQQLPQHARQRSQDLDLFELDPMSLSQASSSVGTSEQVFMTLGARTMPIGLPSRANSLGISSSDFKVFIRETFDLSDDTRFKVQDASGAFTMIPDGLIPGRSYTITVV